MRVPLQKGKELGSGSFGSVYHARELNTGRAVALKQSRVSLRVKRTLLQHEAQVLKLLSGHPVIPQVYAYGRIEHFELLSMQLLGQTLKEVVGEKGPLPVEVVVEIAEQLLSALRHIHGKGLIHRDIKPDNILLQTSGSWNVCLIDFGLAYIAPSNIPPAKYSPELSESVTVFGTLPYASLNAHEGLKLTYRDDLESLAYAFLFFLRGSLPWSYYTKHGTVLGRIRQVREQKRSLTGSLLAVGLPAEFGELVDYARALSAQELPSYQEWRGRLMLIVQSADKGRNIPLEKAQTMPDAQASDYRPAAPVKPGQITLVRLVSSITAEGYSIRAGHQASYIPDHRFDMPEWESLVRPCVILEVIWDEWDKAYKFTAAPISENRELEHGGNRRVPLMSPESSFSYLLQAIVSPRPDWPLKRSFCYAFRRPTTFYFLPSQPTVPNFWSISPGEIEILNTALTPPPNRKPFGRLDALRSPDRDTHDDVRLRTGHAKLYADVYPLTPADIARDSVDWNSTRGWFDECVKASRYYYRCNGDRWTYVSVTGFSEESGEELSDSYYGDDFEKWRLQQERDQSLTLAPLLEEKDTTITGVLGKLDEIELVK